MTHWCFLAQHLTVGQFPLFFYTRMSALQEGNIGIQSRKQLSVLSKSCLFYSKVNNRCSIDKPFKRFSIVFLCSSDNRKILCIRVFSVAIPLDICYFSGKTQKAAICNHVFAILQLLEEWLESVKYSSILITTHPIYTELRTKFEPFLLNFNQN